MTRDQQKKMWACLGDLEKQVKWPVNGEMGYLHREDWRWIMTAALRKEQRRADAIDGAGFVLLGHHTSGMSEKDAGDLIDLITAFGNERKVNWTDPQWQSLVRESQ